MYDRNIGHGTVVWLMNCFCNGDESMINFLNEILMDSVKTRLQVTKLY